MQSVFLIEDDPELASMVQSFLVKNGFSGEIFESGEAAIPRILQDCPDLLILDVNLPGMDGFSVCRSVRSRYSGPILMLTARVADVDEVLGLECGADDYLTKPVRPSVLLARLRSHLRKASPLAEVVPDSIKVGGLEIRPHRRSVELRGTAIELTSTEFDLLLFLVEHAGTPVKRRDLHEALLDDPFNPRDRTIDLRISRLRRKLEDNQKNPTRIKSVQGVGYLLAYEP